jgi:hypothetical protein
MRRLAAALGLAVLAAAASAAPPAPELLFACRDDDWSVTLLGTADGRLLLETRPGGAGMGNVASSWDEVREGYVGGQQGGHQSHIRLYDGFRQIILFEGEDGQLAENPGRIYAGALSITERNPQQDFSIACAADDTNIAIVANVRRWAERSGAKLPLPEQDGSPFDAWF